VILTYH